MKLKRNVLIILVIFSAILTITLTYDTPLQRMAVFTFLFTFPSLILLTIFKIDLDNYVNSEERRSLELEPFFKKYGFIRLENKYEWTGKYRNRDFEISLDSLLEGNTGSSVIITTPNKNGKTISLNFYDKKKMEENGLGDICKKMDNIHNSHNCTHNLFPLEKIAKNRFGVASIYLIDFDVSKNEIKYRIPGYLFKIEKDFIENIDTFCDVLDRLDL